MRVQDPDRSIVPVEGLHPGELAAIALAEELAADALLIDDRDGRRVAERRGVAVLGTLRVLADAAEHGFADLQTAFDRLRQTNFRASEQLLRVLLDRDLARKREL
jgi:predicted nucleic acid-binding protein